MGANYSIIWKHFDKDSTIGKHLSANDNFSLPYFLDGQEKMQFDNKQNVTLTTFHLVKGLLVGYFDKPPGTDTSFAKSKAKEILIEQLSSFQAVSMDNLILDLSSYLRDTHGQLASLQSLMTGTELIPESSTIKYDCCIDLINCIEENEIEDKISAIQKLKFLLSNIRKEDLNSELIHDYHEMIKISEKL